MPDKMYVKRVVAVCCVAAVAALFVLRFDDVLGLLGALWDVASPFAMGLVLAYLLNLVMRLWERLWDRAFAAHALGADGQRAAAGQLASSRTARVLVRLRRPVCLVLALATMAAAVAAVVCLLSGELKVALGSLESGVRAIMRSVSDFAAGDPTLGGLVPSMKDVDAWRDAAREAFDSAGGASGVASLAARWGGNLAHGVLDVVIALVFALYVLAGRERFVQGARSLGRLVLPEKWFARIRHACAVADESFTRFVAGQCLEACILGALCALGGMLLGFPYAGSIGLCVGVTSLVPFIGAWVGGIVGALMIASVSVEQAVWFVLFLVVLQQIEGHLIYPNVVGSSVGMPGIWTFFAVIVGGALFGFIGVLFGVPAVSTIRQLALEWKAEKEKRNASVGV